MLEERMSKSDIKELTKFIIKRLRSEAITVGYTGNEHGRKEGTVWEDSKGRKWIQRKGYVESFNETAETVRKLTDIKCKKCGKNIKFSSDLDEKMILKTGTCFDCTIQLETELRILGIYDVYEKYKILGNQLSYLYDWKRILTDAVNYFKNENNTLKIVTGEDGYMVNFEGVNKTELLNEAKKDLKEVNKEIKNVKKMFLESKKEYNKVLKEKRKEIREFHRQQQKIKKQKESKQKESKQEESKN